MSNQTRIAIAADDSMVSFERINPETNSGEWVPPVTILAKGNGLPHRLADWKTGKEYELRRDENGEPVLVQAMK